MSDITITKVINAKGHPVEVTTVSGNSVYVQPATIAGDAFGRLRVSSPYTLFDSSQRYHDNGLWATSTGVSGAATFNANQGLVDITIGTTSGDFVLRETYKVFPYQPGKSLLTMNTFVMESGQENQRQRVGYFSSGNGIFIEQSGVAAPAIVKRSSVSALLLIPELSKEIGVLIHSRAQVNLDIP